MLIESFFFFFHFSWVSDATFNAQLPWLKNDKNKQKKTLINLNLVQKILKLRRIQHINIWVLYISIYEATKQVCLSITEISIQESTSGAGGGSRF